MGDFGDIEPIRELVYRRLRDRILAGHYSYGTRLIETDLADELGVSRTPVREAIRKLELEGLAQYVKRKGSLVTNLSLQDMEEIYNLREVLEGLACRLAARNLTEEEAAELQRLGEGMKQAYAQDDIELVAEIHEHFNELLYQASRNKRLTEVLQRYNEYIFKSQMISMTREGRPNEIMTEHQAIIDAVVARDATKAEAAARRHIVNARRAFFSRARNGNGETEEK